MGKKKPIILFVCVHNTARSQMAESLLQHYGKDGQGNAIIEAKSCGTHFAPKTHKHAKTAMKELNLSIGKPKIQSPELGPVDYIISLCEADSAACTVVKRKNAVNVSWQIADPAKTQGLDLLGQEEAFRRTRDQLKARVKDFVKLLRSDGWLDMEPAARAKSLLQIHDQQLSFEFLDTLNSTQSGTSDDDLENIKDITLKNLFLRMSIPEIWKASGALLVLLVGAFSAGAYISRL